MNWVIAYDVYFGIFMVFFIYLKSVLKYRGAFYDCLFWAGLWPVFLPLAISEHITLKKEERKYKL